MKTAYIAALPLIIAGCGAAQAGDETKIRYGLSVRQHEALASQLTDARIDEILAGMSELVQIQDSSADVACEVEFVRHGTINTFNNDEIPFTINTEDDFRAVGAAPGSVKVVGRIRWCGGLGQSIIGCANRPGPGLVVVRRDIGDEEPVLWAHEFAHTTGSPHRDIARALMRPQLRIDMREINQTTCDRMLDASFVIHPVPEAARLVASAEEGQPTAATSGPPEEGAPVTTQRLTEAVTGAPMPLDEFLSTTFFEGVPFNLANSFTNQDVPELAAVLEDPARQEAWGNAVATLGAIGTAEAKQVLVDFLLRDPNADLSADTYLAKSNVPVALGWLVNQTGDKEALELLINATTADWWTEEANINWSTPIFKDRESLIADLVASAIVGVTLTGTEEARIRLEQLHNQLDPSAPSPLLSDDEAASIAELGPEARSSITAVSPVTRQAVEQSGGETFIQGQLREFENVTAQGLEGYYAE